MNHIDQLITKHCPDGVKWKALGEVVADVSTGKLNANASKKDGLYPFFTCGITPSKIDIYAFDTEALIVAGNGYGGHVSYYKGKFNAYQRTYVLSGCCKSISIHFMYFYLKAYLKDFAIQHSRKGSVPCITIGTLKAFQIPIPPLPVQEAIVAILDKFPALHTELEAELEARRKQYTYYRNQLLTFDDGVEWKALGEVGTFVRGSGLQKKDFTPTGVGCIHYGQIYTHYGTYAHQTKTFVSEEFAKKLRKAKQGDLVIATTSENDEDVCKAVAWLGEDDIAVSSDACFYRHNLNPKYVAYFFQTEQFQKQKRQYITGTKVRRVNADNLTKLLIPIPPLPVQEAIVAILDRFDALVNDLSQGLPAEITARQKQYTYYRNQLLTFR